jgi:hypothetical protein
MKKKAKKTARRSTSRGRNSVRALSARDKEAATSGLFQPSESPAAPVESQPRVRAMENVVDNLKAQVEVEEKLGEVHEGKVYLSKRQAARRAR